MHNSPTLTPRTAQQQVSMNKYEGDMPEATVEIGTDVGGKSKWKGDEVAAKQSALERAGDRVNGAITGFFYSTGLSIGRNPRKWAFATFFVAVIFGAGIGFPGITNESRGDKLWVPADTEAQDDLKYVDQYYGPEARFGEVILKPADGGDALRPTILDALATLVAGVEATTVEWEGATLSWEDQCFKIGAACVISHINQAFAAATDRDTVAEIFAKVNAAPTSVVTGQPINLDAVLGGVELDANGDVVGAKALRVGFLTKIHRTIVNGDEQDLRGDAYEQELLDLFNEGVDGVDLSFIVQRSFGDEFGEAIGGDVSLLQTALMAILAYAALMLSKWDEGCVGSRVSVTFAGIIAIGLAVASSYGLCSMIGLFYSPLMNVLPFLLLGIGVDDMFVIVNAYDLVTAREPDVDLPRRVGLTLASAGASITVTSLTDIFAFIIGSNTTLPALRNFCFYAAFGILFTFFFQVTWFVAWLTVDEWRRASNRRDIACCLTVPKEACCACCAPRADGRTKMGAWMGQTMGGALTKPAVKYGVLAFFAAIAAGGFAGCAMMQIEADVNDFIPGGSYLKEWIADSNSLFGKLGDPIYVYSRDLDVSTAEGAALMITASDAFKADPYVAETSVESWIEAFNAVRGSTGAFTNADLYAFVNGAGIAYKGDIVWKNESGTAPAEGVASTRMRGNHIKSGSSNGKVASMDSLRDSLSSVENNDGEVFAYSSSWLNYEQYKAVKVEAIRNLSSTMAVMVVIIAFLIVAPRAVLVTCFCLCLIIVNIIGYMHFWDLTLDSVTIIMLVIALGLSVDYSAHIARAYMEHEGTPDERLKLCLEHMGVAVLNGAMSTFLAVLLLGASKSYVFITFFRQLFLCIVFGLAHGLVLLPVLMSFANPKPYAQGAHITA